MMFCRLNFNAECDCCGTCMSQDEEKEVSVQCYVCGNWIDKNAPCFVILDKIICPDCVDDAYFSTLEEAMDDAG